MKRLLLTALVFLAITCVIEAQEPEYDEFVFLPLIMRAPPITLTVIGKQSVWAEDIEWHIVGEVYNGTPHHLTNVKVPTDIFDSDGCLIETERGLAAVSPLFSRDKTCFRVDIYPADLKWDHYVLNNPLYSFISEEEPIKNLVVHDDYGEYHPYFDGRMYKIFGWVRNDNPFKVYYVDANVTLYNADGVVIGCSRWNDISTYHLDPGQDSSFEVNIWDWEWNGEDIAYYRTQIDASR